MKIPIIANGKVSLRELGFSMLRTPLDNIIEKLTKLLQAAGYHNK